MSTQEEHRLFGVGEDTTVECPEGVTISATAEVSCPVTIQSTWRYCPYCGAQLEEFPEGSG